MNIHCLFLSQTSHHKKHHFRNIAMTVCLHTSNIFHFLIVQFDFQARQKKKIQSFSLHRNKRLSKHIYLSIITGVLISPAFDFLGSFGSAAKVFQIDRIITRIAAWTTNLPLFILWNPPVSDFAWALINLCNFRKRCSPFRTANILGLSQARPSPTHRVLLSRDLLLWRLSHLILTWVKYLQ